MPVCVDKGGFLGVDLCSVTNLANRGRLYTRGLDNCVSSLFSCLSARPGYQPLLGVVRGRGVDSPTLPSEESICLLFFLH